MESEIDVDATKKNDILEGNVLSERKDTDIGCVNVGYEDVVDEVLVAEPLVDEVFVAEPLVDEVFVAEPLVDEVFVAEQNGSDVNSRSTDDIHRKKRKSHSHGTSRKHRYDLKRSASTGSRFKSSSSLPLSSVDETIEELPEYLDSEIQDEGIVFTVPNSQSSVNLQLNSCDENDVTVDDGHLTSSTSSSDGSIVVVDIENETELIADNRSRKRGVVPIGDTKDKEENARDTKVLCFLLEVHLLFTKIGLIAHGCAGGVAVAHCIFIFYFLKKNDSQLLENYTDIALVFQILYYLLLSISTVSVFDRYININADFPEALRHIVEKPIRSVGIVSFCLALIFSVSLSRLDDKIIMSQDQETSVTHYEIITWKILNLLRVLTCIIGWVTIAISPADDITANSAKNLIARRKEKDLHCLIGTEHDDVT